METSIRFLILFGLIAFVAILVATFKKTENRRQLARRLLLWGGGAGTGSLLLILLVGRHLHPVLQVPLGVLNFGGFLAALPGYSAFILWMKPKPSETTLQHLGAQTVALLFGLCVFLLAAFAGPAFLAG